MTHRFDLTQALAADERSLAMDMLLRDRLAEFIQDGERWRWVDKALVSGRDAAASLRAQQGGLGARELAERLGIVVHFDTSDHTAARLLFMSTYEALPPRITLYSATLSLLRDMLALHGLGQDQVPLEQVSIAHELFHHLDQMQPDASVRQHFRVVTFRLGPWRRQATVGGAIEIAAHSFAKTLLGLERFPGILDYLVRERQA